MKPIVLLAALLFFTVVRQAAAQSTNPLYDQKLAESLDADQYGMRQYYLVILKSGANQVEDKEKKAAAFKGHMDNYRPLG